MKVKRLDDESLEILNKIDSKMEPIQAELDQLNSEPADPLLCWYDYGSDLTLASGETLTIDFTTSTFTVT